MITIEKISYIITFDFREDSKSKYFDQNLKFKLQISEKIEIGNYIINDYQQ